MKRVVFVLGSIAGLAVIFYASLFVFSEIYTEVVVLRTLDVDGLSQETRVTIIDVDDSAWVRGRPYRGWFRRVEEHSSAELYRGGLWHPVRATVSRDPAHAAAFEQAMRERYGLLYRFFDFFARMSTNEIPVRLDPREPKRPDA